MIMGHSDANLLFALLLWIIGFYYREDVLIFWLVDFVAFKYFDNFNNVEKGNTPGRGTPAALDWIYLSPYKYAISFFELFLSIWNMIQVAGWQFVNDYMQKYHVRTWESMTWANGSISLFYM